MTLALYRAYRPGTLAEVVGQDHVTAPLGRALSTGRVHHAYLFSGPRGCGKTSTARILARSLNCERGPTPEPCGVCSSCIALAPNGPGSEDVVELDAASHGGVDDTRELRERVIYSPARSRYRIYIIDEAHMVTTQGFNALLKVIEEPPDYVRFIFATTEPEKVLGTIRSRTFHYSFRLVATSVLSTHLASVCRTEGVPYDEAALPLVAKAAGGSVRDALSLLGQLIAGSDDAGVTQELVTAGLGLTDAVLLDRVVAAIAARDGAAAFAAVDAVVESGHDGRRFLTDLLERLRDLIVLQHVPAERQASLLQLPADQVEALRLQGELFGPAELSRAADLVSAGLSELKGATAPRLQLELLFARLLLPSADDGDEGLAARLDRLERRVAAGVVHAPAAHQPSPAPQQPTPASTAPAPAGHAPAGEHAAARDAGGAASGRHPRAEQGDAGRAQHRSRSSARSTPPPKLSDLAPATGPGSAQPKASPAPEGPASGAASSPPANGASASPGPGWQPAQAPASTGPAAPQSGATPSSGRSAAPDAAQTPAGQDSGDADIATVRDGWAAVMTELGKRSRVAWTLWESSRPLTKRGGELTVAVADQGRLSSIKASRREELLRQVLIDVVRIDVQIVPVLAPQERSPDQSNGAASADDPDLAEEDVNGVDLVVRELGAVRIGEIGEA